MPSPNSIIPQKIYSKISKLLDEEKREKFHQLYQFWEDFDLLGHLLGDYSLSYNQDELFSKIITDNLPSFKNIEDYAGSTFQVSLWKIWQGIKAAQREVRFPRFMDLDFFLQVLGGCVLASSFEVVYRKELQERQFASIAPLEQLGNAVLFWEILKNSSRFVARGKFFIPLEDLNLYSVWQQDLIAQIEHPKIKELTHFELNKINDNLSLVKKLSKDYTNDLSKILLLVCDHFRQEVKDTLRSDWSIISNENPLNIKKRKLFGLSLG